MFFFTVDRRTTPFLALLMLFSSPALAGDPGRPIEHPDPAGATARGTTSPPSAGPAMPAGGGPGADVAAAAADHQDTDRLIHAPLQAIANAGHRLVAVGSHGLIILSDDDGGTWRQVSSPVSAGLTGIGFGDDHVGWATGHDGVVLHTADGGEHWTLVQDGAAAAQAILKAAENGSEADSVRAGRIKAAQALVADPTRPFVLMQVADADTVRLIGTGDLSSETTDGGKTWRPWFQAINNPAGSPLYGLAQRGGVLVLVGAGGTVLVGRPEDGLRAVKPPGEATLFGVTTPSDTVLVYGQQGHVFESSVSLIELGAGKAPEWRAVPDPSQTTITAGFSRGDGKTLFGDAAGVVWRLAGKPGEGRLVQTAGSVPFAILGMVEAADASMVAVGSGGVSRISTAAQDATAGGS